MHFAAFYVICLNDIKWGCHCYSLEKDEIYTQEFFCFLAQDQYILFTSPCLKQNAMVLWLLSVLCMLFLVLVLCAVRVHWSYFISKAFFSSAQKYFCYSSNMNTMKCSPLLSCFIVGLATFLMGMLINIHSDHVLRNLRKPGETAYKIPHGKEYYTCSINTCTRLHPAYWVWCTMKSDIKKRRLIQNYKILVSRKSQII